MVRGVEATFWNVWNSRYTNRQPLAPVAASAVSDSSDCGSPELCVQRFVRASDICEAINAYSPGRSADAPREGLLSAQTDSGRGHTHTILLLSFTLKDSDQVSWQPSYVVKKSLWVQALSSVWNNVCVCVCVTSIHRLSTGVKIIYVRYNYPPVNTHTHNIYNTIPNISILLPLIKCWCEPGPRQK